MPRIASGWSAAVQSAADRAGMSASRWDRHTRIVRRLHLMADYECHPRLESQEEGLHNVDPFELAIPEQLAQALTEWAASTPRRSTSQTPRRPGFGTGRRRTGGFGGGSALAAQLRGAGFDASYFHEGQSPRTGRDERVVVRSDARTCRDEVAHAEIRASPPASRSPTARQGHSACALGRLHLWHPDCRPDVKISTGRVHRDGRPSAGAPTCLVPVGGSSIGPGAEAPRQGGDHHRRCDEV